MPQLINQTNEEFIISKYQGGFNPVIYSVMIASEGNLLQMLLKEIYQSQLLKKSDQFEEKATLETPKIL